MLARTGLRAGDLCLTLGAGNVDELGRTLVAPQGGDGGGGGHAR